jgi:hypothetical protein
VGPPERDKTDRDSPQVVLRVYFAMLDEVAPLSSDPA